MARAKWVIPCVIACFSMCHAYLSNAGRKRAEKELRDVQNTVTPKISPKVFIISMFGAERVTWHDRDPTLIDLGGRTIELPGLIDKNKKVYCTSDGNVCQLVTGMGLINAALSISALLASPQFDFSKTYFLIAGVGGISPKVGTLGSVVLAKYAIQIDLQYELDAREMPSEWKTGYFPQGSHSPNEPPQTLYGTEVYELNENLRSTAVELARSITLLSSSAVKDYCSRFRPADTIGDADCYPATMPPIVIEADVTSSNVFFHGNLLSEAFSNTCKVFTDNAAKYAITAQEDNGTLAALLLGAQQGKLDFSRIILLRAASNFDQPPAGEQPEIPLHAGHGGFPLAIENIYRAGIEIVKGILIDWERTFDIGIPPDNYVGDILGALGGKPLYGPLSTLRTSELESEPLNASTILPSARV